MTTPRIVSRRSVSPIIRVERRTGLDIYRSVIPMKKLGASILIAVGLVAGLAAPSSAVSLDKGDTGRVSLACAYCWPTPGAR